MIAADVSGNDDVLAFDASYILRYSIVLVTQFPVRADWTFIQHDFPTDDTNWFTSPHSRSYAPLQSDQFNQNYMGILYGDVSGNWARSITTDSLPKIELTVSSIQQTNERKCLIALELKFPDIAYSGCFKMLVNNPDLKFESGSLDNSSTPDVSLPTIPEPGEVKVAFASSQSLNVKGIKISLLFNQQNPVTPSVSDFQFADVMIDERSAVITVVEILNPKKLPTEWNLSQNDPNPFNPETIISYQIPKSSHVRVEVFNLIGQRIRTLVDEKKDLGTYQITWDGLDENGLSVGSGIYIYKMRADGFMAIKKMVLVR